VLKKSEIHGLGIFARHPIKKDEIITFYPGDIIEYMPNGDRDQNHHIVAIFRSQRFTQLYGATKDIKYRDNDYVYHLNKNYTIIGCTHFKDEANYMGHFINDANKADESPDSIQSYQKISRKIANCKFKSQYDLHITIIATRDIVQGEELFLSYGLGYWLDHDTE
jgi:SET domain-containing protein